VAAHQENIAKPPLKAQTGWSVQNDHPVRAFLTILMARPPLLSQEGNTLLQTTLPKFNDGTLAQPCYTELVLWRTKPNLRVPIIPPSRPRRIASDLTARHGWRKPRL